MTNHRIIGIDPSLTATGYCLPDGSTHVASWPGTRGVQRLALAYAELLDTIETWNPTLIVIESYAYGRANQAHQLGELGGVLRLAAEHACATLLDVPPTVVKKYATGKGNANKDLVRDAARDRLGLPAGVSSDECDAAWLRQVGLAVLEDPTMAYVPETHMAALTKLTIPENVA